MFLRQRLKSRLWGLRRVVPYGDEAKRSVHVDG